MLGLGLGLVLIVCARVRVCASASVGARVTGKRVFHYRVVVVADVGNAVQLAWLVLPRINYTIIQCSQYHIYNNAVRCSIIYIYIVQYDSIIHSVQ